MLKNATLKTKLVSLVVTSLIVLTVVVSISAVTEVTNKMMTNATHKLESIRDSKSNQVTKFFDERIGDINVLARSANIRGVMGDLGEIYEDVEFDLNGNFPIKNELVKRTTKSHEEFFQGYMKDYGYYDVFVIHAKTVMFIIVPQKNQTMVQT